MSNIIYTSLNMFQVKYFDYSVLWVLIFLGHEFNTVTSFTAARNPIYKNRNPFK